MRCLVVVWNVRRLKPQHLTIDGFFTEANVLHHIRERTRKYLLLGVCDIQRKCGFVKTTTLCAKEVWANIAANSLQLLELLLQMPFP